MSGRILKSKAWPVWPSRWLARRERAAQDKRPSPPRLSVPAGNLLRFRPSGGIEDRTSS